MISAKSTTMNVPAEFRILAAGFYQGSADEHPTIEEWIASALRFLDAEQKKIVKRFLSDLLDNNLDDSALQKIWNSTDSDYYITADNGLRSFFTAIRDMIE
jgi:hypothetical protein